VSPSNLPSPSLPDPGTAVAIAVAVIVVLLALFLLWSVVGATMEFVLLAGLCDRDVRIRRPFRANLRRGLRLLGFRLAVGVGSLLLIGLPVALVIGLGIGLSPALLLLVIPLFSLLLVVALLGSVVLGLTTDFVVPAMFVEDRGVLDGWRRIWPVVRDQPKQTVAFVVVKFVLGIVVSLAVSVAVLLTALVVVIPFALVGGGLVLALSAAGVGGAVPVAIAGLLAIPLVLVLIVAALSLQVPAIVFVRYYSLSVLAMLDSELDPAGLDPSNGGTGPGGHDDGEGTEHDATDPMSDHDDDAPPRSTACYCSPSCRRSVVSISGWRA
jgi:hypothetical protein